MNIFEKRISQISTVFKASFFFKSSLSIHLFKIIYVGRKKNHERLIKRCMPLHSNLFVIYTDK